jgi:hypothetical protein
VTTPQGNPLRIHTKFHWLTFMLAAVKPKATINGYEVRLNWGDNVIPAPTGRHEVSVHVPYLWTFGRATTTVDNTMGSPALYYAAPVWTFQRGAIGTAPQAHPGLTAAWIVYGVFFAVVLLCCLGTIVASMNGS